MLPLASVTRRSVVWSPTLTAECRPPDIGHPSAWPSAVPEEHGAPLLGCNCGIYGWYAPNDARMLNARVFGVIEASGLVLMGDRGFRAERARIAAVATRHRRVAAACEAAGISVYRRRRDLLRDYPPEDPSSLLGEPSDQQQPGERREPSRSRLINGFDRALFLAVWVRTAIIAVAVVALPLAAAIAAAVMAELALVGMLLMRAR